MDAASSEALSSLALVDKLLDFLLQVTGLLELISLREPGSLDWLCVLVERNPAAPNLRLAGWWMELGDWCGWWWRNGEGTNPASPTGNRAAKCGNSECGGMIGDDGKHGSPAPVLFPLLLLLLAAAAAAAAYNLKAGFDSPPLSRTIMTSSARKPAAPSRGRATGVRPSPPTHFHPPSTSGFDETTHRNFTRNTVRQVPLECVFQQPLEITSPICTLKSIVHVDIHGGKLAEKP